MFDSKRARVAALSGALVTAAAVSAAGGAAIAQPGTDAPHTRVAGVINADAGIKHAKGITGVTRPRTGVYCVRTAIPDVRPAIALATSWSYGRIVSAFTAPHAECRDRIDTVRVTVVDHNLKTVNSPFTIALP
jgi:hypothetical protein